jgi:hypothetical protein
LIRSHEPKKRIAQNEAKQIGLAAGVGFAEQLLEISFGCIQRDPGVLRVGADALASDQRL